MIKLTFFCNLDENNLDQCINNFSVMPGHGGLNIPLFLFAAHLWPKSMVREKLVPQWGLK
jgi:hypothetical protein